MKIEDAIKLVLTQRRKPFTAKDLAKIIFQSAITPGESIRVEKSCYYALWLGEKKGKWRQIKRGIYFAY